MIYSMAMKKKKIISRLLLLMPLVLCMGLLTGCSGTLHYWAVKNKALKYYEDKYDISDVGIEKTFKAGPVDGILGGISSKDRGYELSDGYCVYWNEDTEEYSDDRQAEEVAAAFDEEIMKPLLKEFSIPVKASSYNLSSSTLPVIYSRSLQKNYHACAYNASFDGDLKTFLAKEKPKLRDYSLALESSDTDACEKEIKKFAGALKETVPGYVDIYITDGELDKIDESGWGRAMNRPEAIAQARLNFQDDTIQWTRQSYIEIFDGIFVSCKNEDVLFEEGDVIPEEVGTCEMIQQSIDENYDAQMADDTADKKTLEHEILDDPQTPCYRLTPSQRVIDALGDDPLEVSVLDKRKEGLPLMAYYPDRQPMYVYQVCWERDLPYREELKPDNLYFFNKNDRGIEQ